ncbi:MAG: hypothetical protein R6W96_01920 [Clostridia bacterium]
MDKIRKTIIWMSLLLLLSSCAKREPVGTPLPDPWFQPDAVETVKVVHAPEGGRIMVQYPEITGMADGELSDMINGSIRDMAMEDVMTYPEDGYVSYELFYDVPFLNSRMVSVLFRGYQHHQHAAHPGFILKGLTIGLAKGDRLVLSDLFADGEDHEARIREFVMQSEQYSKYESDFDLLLFDYLAPGTAGFVLFIDHLLVFYEVPHVLGDHLVFEVPYEDMMDIIDVEGPIWRGIVP